MKQHKLFLNLLAVVIAVVAAFAFSPKPEVKSSPTVDYWLKYDCSNPDQVQNTDNNRTTGVPAPCVTLPSTVCAKRFPEGSLELNPAFPPERQIYRLINPNETSLESRYCP